MVFGGCCLTLLLPYYKQNIRQNTGGLKHVQNIYAQTNWQRASV
jgi:hypothetical protein